MIAVIKRYGLISTSLLVRLVGGNEDVTYRRLRNLYDLGLVNRFSLPRTVGPPGEFIYYLDNAKALDLLHEHGGIPAERLDREAIWRNREKAYADLLDPVKAQYRLGSLFFIQHELTISRLHAMLELGCQRSEGRIRLAEWRQGPELWNRIGVPKMLYDNERRVWVESDEVHMMSHRPDAYFTLHLPGNPDGQQHVHFFYEADRGTTSTETARLKFRTYFHFIVRAKKIREDYDVRRVRAVLVETTDKRRVEDLRAVARHPTVCRETASPLFWFTISPLFTKTQKVEEGSRVRDVPHHLARPEVVFDKIWLPASHNTFCSLLD